MRLIACFLSIFIHASAHAEESSRYIDRRYTLPMGSSQMDLNVGYERHQVEANAPAAALRFEFDYRRPIDDKRELVWAPIPTGIRYRIESPAGMERGASWSLNFFYRNFWGVHPVFASYFRQKWNDWS